MPSADAQLTVAPPQHRLFFMPEPPGHGLFRQFEVLQVKEKFGGLRVHVKDGNDAIRRRIEAAIQESFHTCEVCGQSGKLREDGLIKTLCDEHEAGATGAEKHG